MNLYSYIYNLYRSFGATPAQAELVLSQNMLETANFTSPLFISHNNIGGVAYIGQSGATQGAKQPEKNSGYYAKFRTVADSARSVWATVYIPLKYSTDSASYAKNLKIRPDKYPPYYGDGTKNPSPQKVQGEINSYKKNLELWLPEVKKMNLEQYYLGAKKK